MESVGSRLTWRWKVGGGVVRTFEESGAEGKVTGEDTGGTPALLEVKRSWSFVGFEATASRATAWGQND